MKLPNEQLESLIIPCFGNTPVTCLTLFPDHFTRPFCSVHNSIFQVLDNEEIKLAAIAAPRGFGKTTTIGLGFVGRKALFREAPYIVYISSTATEAAAKVKTLAKELQENDIIKGLFGELRGVKWAEEKGEIELSDAEGPFCFIQAKGAGSQIRGLKWGKYRPTLFVVDDLEDAEEVCNETIRKKLKEWFFADLLGARDQSVTSKTRLIVIGTLLHEDSLLANLLDESPIDEDDKAIMDLQDVDLKEQFVTLRLEACDDSFNSVWPEYLSTEALKAKAAAYERRGLLDVFYREWRNIVIAKDNATFQKSMFRYYSETDDRERLREVETIVLVDPAKTANTASAFTAICAVGFDARCNRIYFRDSINAKLTPDKIYEAAFDMADMFNAVVVGVEETGLNNFIMYPFQQAARKRRRFVDVVAIKALKDKELRVGALAYFYRVGAVYHNEQLHVRGTLETQLLSFPRSKYWDMMDCFANCIELFNLGDRNFTQDVPEVYGLDKHKMDEFELLELSYKQEPKFTGWRYV
jgi:predicted phage terminase large subunit-like protein